MDVGAYAHQVAYHARRYSDAPTPGQALETILQQTNDARTRDIAQLGLSFGAGATTPEASEVAQRAALETLAEKEPSLLEFGRRLCTTECQAGTHVENLAQAEAILHGVAGAAVGGPVGTTTTFALNVGKRLREESGTGTRHSQFSTIFPEDAAGEPQSFDFPAVAGVYAAAFQSLMEGGAQTPSELAALGQAMMRPTEYAAYTAPPRSLAVIADETFNAIGTSPQADADEKRWAGLGRQLAPRDPSGAASRILLQTVEKGVVADALSMTEFSQRAADKLPPAEQGLFAQSAITLVAQAPAPAEPDAEEARAYQAMLGIKAGADGSAQLAAMASAVRQELA